VFVARRAELLDALRETEAGGELDAWLARAFARVGRESGALAGTGTWALQVSGAALEGAWAELVALVEAGLVTRFTHGRSSVVIDEPGVVERCSRVAATRAELTGR
jgi:hypothetical protein